MAATRKSERKSKKGTRKQSGGKRAPSDWNREVKAVYTEMKAKNPATQFKEALVEAARRRKTKH
jgi:hypothetical protein